jgi:hypothetical protein
VGETLMGLSLSIGVPEMSRGIKFYYWGIFALADAGLEEI